jgi:hypothetical protein
MIFDNVDDITQQQLQQQKQTNEQTEKDSYDNKLERKIAIATQGIIDYAVRKLRRLGVQSQGKRTTAASTIGRQNIETICNYLIAVNAEINPSIMYKINKLQVLCLLSEFHNNQKSFLQMTRNDILDYLDNLCRPEASDPEHKWIGTYNLRRIYFLRFFKWLYNPDLNPKERIYLQYCGFSTQFRCCEPYIRVLPKCLSIFNGLSHILKACPLINFMLIGTSVTGTFPMVIVAVPLNVVELLLIMGLPISLKFDIVWV